MIDEVVDTRDYSRPWCPECQPDADPMDEILQVRWCDTHEPKRDGIDDERIVVATFPSGSAEAEGGTCKAFADVLRQPR